MLLDREEITHALDHALTAIAALRGANEGNQTAIILGQIEDAMDAAFVQLSRPARLANLS
jgi:hypothetical protein